MKRISITIGALAGLLFSVHGVKAQQGPATGCSNATLTGTYGVTVNGMRPSPSNPFAFEQMIGIVLHTFDGQGSFTQTDNVKGSISGITPDRPGSGTYSVNSDCTGSYTLNLPAPPFQIVTRFVIVEGGKEFRAVVVSPQSLMITANGRKM